MFELQQIERQRKNDREKNQTEGDEGHLRVVSEEEDEHDNALMVPTIA